MAWTIEIHVQRLPEGVYLATSADVPGLTVEAESREEALRIAPQVALDLVEEECGGPLPERPQFSFQFD
jgi:predicted RNase H-like HicB family nuclease